MSVFSARWTLLFLIFDKPYLTRFVIFSISWSIRFFPSTECIALEPIFIPNFAIVLASPLPGCILRYFCLILLALLTVLVHLLVYCWCIESYPFLFGSCFSLNSRSNCSCFCYSYVSWQVFSTYSLVSSYERCTVRQSNSFWDNSTTKKDF